MMEQLFFEGQCKREQSQACLNSAESSLNSIFYQLIRVSIGTQVTLSKPPSAVEWKELYAMAKKQSLVGISFAGLQKLYYFDNQEPSTHNPQPDPTPEPITKNHTQEITHNPEPITHNLDEVHYLTWMGMAAQINMKNEQVNEQCVELQKRLAAEGYRSSILKGQGVAMLYGEELRGFRQSGDIDIYVDCGRVKAIEYARSVQGDVDWDYKHLHLEMFDGPSTGSGTSTAVEMHYVPEVFLNLRKNRKLQKWFKEPGVQSSMFQSSKFQESPTAGSGTVLTTPSVEFNLFYILLHTYRHFLYEGVGMRQLMDYYFVLRASSELPGSKIQEVARTIESFGMKRFASGVMWIMKDVFGFDVSSAPALAEVCRPDEKEGRYILSEVMTGGNFGHHDERLADERTTGKMRSIKKILKHNLHLLTHYLGDTLWAPVWIVYHWCWKRSFQRKLKRKKYDRESKKLQEL